MLNKGKLRADQGRAERKKRRPWTSATPGDNTNVCPQGSDWVRGIPSLPGREDSARLDSICRWSDEFISLWKMHNQKALSNVVNRRKEISQDGKGATVRDWLEEKEGKIDWETFECLHFLKILSQLSFKLGQLDPADMCGDEIWAGTKGCFIAHVFRWLPHQIGGPLRISAALGFQQPSLRSAGKCSWSEKPSHWPDIRSGNPLRGRLGPLPY